MHHLFDHQLKKAMRDGRLDIDVLATLISQAYADYERERRRTDHSIRVMVEELGEVSSSMKAREEELRAVGAGLRATLDNVSQGVMTVNPQGRIEFFNEKMVSYTGLTVEDYQGNPKLEDVLQKLVAHGEFTPMGQEFETWIKEKSAIQGTFTHQRVRPDGTVLEVVSKRLADGSVVRTIADITSYVSSASQIEDLSKMLHSTLDNVSQGVLAIGPNNRIKFFNDKFAYLTGLKPEDYQGNPTSDEMLQKVIASGEYDLMSDDFRKWVAENSGNQGAFTYQRTRPDGTVVEVFSKRLPDGSVVRTIADVTSYVSSVNQIKNLSKTLRVTLDNIAEGVMMVDSEGFIVTLNDRVGELMQIPSDVLKVGATLRSVVDWQIAHNEFKESSQEFLAKTRENRPLAGNVHYERKRPNGKIIEIQSRMLPDNANVYTYRDITEIRKREQELKAAEESYRSLFDNATVGIYRVSVDGQIITCNQALAVMQGYESVAEFMAAVANKRINCYLDPARRDEFITQLRTHGRISDFVSQMRRHKNNELFWVSEAAWAVFDDSGKLDLIEGMLVDATDRITAQESLDYAASHDVLTGLPNRTNFVRNIVNILRQNADRKDIALLYMDLDHFKDINDTMGHESGDVLIRLVSRRLERLLPQGGMLSRFGGDEFSIMLFDVPQREDVVAVIDTILHAMDRPFRLRGNPIYIGMSIGAVHTSTDGNDANELMKKADVALYRTKQGGRGSYMFFDPAMTASIQARRTIEVELRRAIANNEFRVVYQPIVDVSTGKPASFEALLRWEHPSRGRLSPFEFIEVAEHTGQIVQIGEMVLNQACRDVVNLPGMPDVSVNLSPVQFRNHQLGASVVQALVNSGLAPQRLILEITESVLLENDARTLNVLEQLRALGVKIALDDFGVGHSSFSYLQKFPFDKIKIDRAFVQDKDNSKMNAAIRRAVLGLGRDLGIDVICEGVETTEQSTIVVTEGCRYIQGYLFGRPADPDVAFADLLRPKAAGE